MKKLIDIPEEAVKPLKIKAVHAGKDLKNYIQDLLAEHAKEIDTPPKGGDYAPF